MIPARIVEVGIKSISYKVPGYETGPMFIISKDEVWKIILGNGQTVLFQSPVYMLDSFSAQHLNAFKVDFFAPLLDHCTFTFEHSIKPGRSWEVSAAIIGMGIRDKDQYVNQNGCFIKIGYKFIQVPSSFAEQMRYTHILMGLYARPVLTLGSYSENYLVQNPLSSYYSPSMKQDEINYGGITIEFGKQWVIDNVAVTDLYFGFGYSVLDHSADNINYGELEHGLLCDETQSPLTFTTGLRIGFVFK